ncbi:MAG: REP element-mobilizing transposase RayT [Polaribacter sp.]|jgi:REP element-mobilizing transposase RayT
MCTDVISKKDCEYSKKYHGTRDFQTTSRSEKIFMGGKFWTSGYYINTVGQYANEEVIKKYVQGQGSNQKYQKTHKSQLKLF